MKVLLVCTGNTCRSSMARVIFEKLAEEMGLHEVQVSSAGTAAVPGQPASDNAVLVAREMGLDLTAHTATQLTPEMVKEADLVLVMTRTHLHQVQAMVPEDQGKVRMLSFEDDIADPFGRDIEVYRMVARQIQEASKRVIEELLQGRSDPEKNINADRDKARTCVAIGSDHGGFELKQLLKEEIEALGYDVLDMGVHSHEPVDYPDIALAVSKSVQSGQASLGVLVCGTGIGMSITANKVRGIRAALCHDTYSARMSREHNDANVLAMGARVIGPELAREVLRAWLAGKFAGGRHQRRVDKIGNVESGC